MTVSILADGIEIVEKHIKFSDGGSNIKIKTGLEPKKIVVTIKDEPVDGQLYLYELVRELLSFFYPEVKVTIHAPYLPHGRADRAFEEGTITPLFLICDSIWWCDELIVRDPHSDFTKLFFEDSLTEYTEISQLQSLIDAPFSALKKYDFDILVAPDKGAKEKTQNIAEYFDAPFVTCDKDRDPATGWINSVIVNGDVKGKRCMITDDICDGGGTFLLTAKALREQGAESVSLYVTHGIFSKGLDIFEGLIDCIVCFHTVMDHVTMQDVHKFNKGGLQ